MGTVLNNTQIDILQKEYNNNNNHKRSNSISGLHNINNDITNDKTDMVVVNVNNKDQHMESLKVKITRNSNKKFTYWYYFSK